MTGEINRSEYPGQLRAPGTVGPLRATIPADKSRVTAIEAPETLSPELALVCPELRAAAIAALPNRDPDVWLDRLKLSAVPDPVRPAPVYELMQALDRREDPVSVEGEPATFVVAVAAYALTSASRFALEAAALVGVVIGLLAVVAVAHS
jgi:hypothetical protein